MARKLKNIPKSKPSAGLRGAAQQLEILNRLSQKSAAYLVSTSARSLRDASDLPRNPDGTYNGRELVKWVSERAARSVPASETAAPNSLDDLRSEKARLAQLDRLERENALVPRDLVHQAMTRLATILRGAGERLGRDYGVDAADVLNQALLAFQAEIEANEVFKNGWK